MKAPTAVLAAIIASLIVIGFIAIVFLFAAPVLHCVQGGCNDEADVRFGGYPGYNYEADADSDAYTTAAFAHGADTYAYPHGFYHGAHDEPVVDVSASSITIASRESDRDGDGSSYSWLGVGVLIHLFYDIVSACARHLFIILFGIIVPFVFIAVGTLCGLLRCLRRRFGPSIPVFSKCGKPPAECECLAKAVEQTVLPVAQDACATAAVVDHPASVATAAATASVDAHHPGSISVHAIVADNHSGATNTIVETIIPQ